MSEETATAAETPATAEPQEPEVAPETPRAERVPDGELAALRDTVIGELDGSEDNKELAQDIGKLLNSILRSASALERLAAASERIAETVESWTGSAGGPGAWLDIRNIGDED